MVELVGHEAEEQGRVGNKIVFSSISSIRTSRTIFVAASKRMCS